MKVLITLCCAVLLLSAYTKEVGKEPYLFELTFTSGEVVPLRVYVYEKAKKYENQNVQYNINVQDQTNAIYIESDPIALHFVVFKQNENRLVGIDDINFWKTSVVDFAGGQEVIVYGSIELDGPYTKKGREFTVENGTFTITWTNSYQYSVPAPKVTTGTWRMERE